MSDTSGEFGRPGRRRSVPIDSDSDSDRRKLRRGDGGARGVKRLHFYWGFRRRIQICHKCCSFQATPTNVAMSKESFLTKLEPKYFWGAPSKKGAECLISNCRDIVGQLIRFLTGHAFLKRHNAKVFHGISPPPGEWLAVYVKIPLVRKPPTTLSQSVNISVLGDTKQWVPYF